MVFFETQLYKAAIKGNVSRWVWLKVGIPGIALLAAEIHSDVTYNMITREKFIKWHV